MEQPQNFEKKEEIETNEVTPENQQLLVEIRRKLDNSKTDQQLLAEAERYAKHENLKAFIAREGDKAAGFAELILEDEELPSGAPEIKDIQALAHLARVGVLEEYRGRGIAKNLLFLAEEYARSSGKKGIWLDYLAENESAIALYLSSGYDDMAEFKDGNKDRIRRIAIKYFYK